MLEIGDIISNEFGLQRFQSEEAWLNPEAKPNKRLQLTAR